MHINVLLCMSDDELRIASLLWRCLFTDATKDLVSSTSNSLLFNSSLYLSLSLSLSFHLLNFRIILKGSAPQAKTSAKFVCPLRFSSSFVWQVPDTQVSTSDVETTPFYGEQLGYDSLSLCNRLARDIYVFVSSSTALFRRRCCELC